MMAALIPARAGSIRCPGKNTRLLGGIPLITWTIEAARRSAVCHELLVCTDDPRIWAMDWPGVRILRRDPVPDTQPDIVWMLEAIRETPTCEVCAILRPTAPFRTAATILRAVDQFCRSEIHSLRAVERATQNPWKMWRWAGPGSPLQPLLPTAEPIPLHSQPSQNAPAVYIQNASLELVWTWVVRDLHSISGTKIAPFFTEGLEGFDINREQDFAEAEALVAQHPEWIPTVSVSA